MLWLFPAVVLIAAPAAVLAQERPEALPTRDVDVTYRSEQAGQVIEQRTRFASAVQRMRLDLPTPGLYTIMDYRAHTLSVVSDPDRGVLDMATPPGAGPGVITGATAYTRRGEDTVAGLRCTEWETLDSRGQPALTCFTADGVMLRARRGAQVLAVATRVAYGALDPSVFTVPPGYNRVTKQAPP